MSSFSGRPLSEITSFSPVTCELMTKVKFGKMNAPNGSASRWRLGWGVCSVRRTGPKWMSGSLPADVRVAVVADVVRVAPRLLVDGRVPAERLGRELLAAREPVVGAVQGGVADLGRLQLLVHPERADAREERHGLEAEVDETLPTTSIVREKRSSLRT